MQIVKLTIILTLIVKNVLIQIMETAKFNLVNGSCVYANS